MKKTKLEEIDFENDLLEVGKDVLENLKNILNPDVETQIVENISLSDEQAIYKSIFFY